MSDEQGELELPPMTLTGLPPKARRLHNPSAFRWSRREEVAVRMLQLPCESDLDYDETNVRIAGLVKRGPICRTGENYQTELNNLLDNKTVSQHLNGRQVTKSERDTFISFCDRAMCGYRTGRPLSWYERHRAFTGYVDAFGQDGQGNPLAPLQVSRGQLIKLLGRYGDADLDVVKADVVLVERHGRDKRAPSDPPGLRLERDWDKIKYVLARVLSPDDEFVREELWREFRGLCEGDQR